MYRVAVCDNEETEIAKIRRGLSGWQVRHLNYELKIKSFTDAKDLIDLFQEGRYAPDVLFLDVYMPGASGIVVAKDIRDMGYEGEIVFITTSREHALEAFGVNALQYLVKPVEAQRLSSVLDMLFVSGREKRKDCILLRIDGRVCRISVDDIVYCEAQGKNQCLHLLHDVRQQLHMSMLEIHDMLSERQKFVRVGVSYIVNLDHVDSLNAQKICLDNGENIFLPRGAYQPLREQYFHYYCESV